jgi:hypothetical protein
MVHSHYVFGQRPEGPFQSKKFSLNMAASQFILYRIGYGMVFWFKLTVTGDTLLRSNG